jgi:beta-galactosidase
MPRISRRDLLGSGLALSTSSLMARTAWAHTAAMFSPALRTADPQAAGQESTMGAAPAAIAPREQFLFDFGWKFMFGHGSDPARDLGFGKSQDDFAKTGDFKFAKVGYDDSKWCALNLPHDWAVELPFVRDEAQQSHGYKPLGRRYPETSVGWYRKEFDIPANDAGRRVNLEFDGAFRDVLLFVNGCFIGRNDNGYAPFCFDITDFLAVGAKNCVVARVDASYGDGWFYEGAGIYRHVWLTKTDPLHFVPWESYVRADLRADDAALSVGAIFYNWGAATEAAHTECEIFDSKGNLVGLDRGSAAMPLQIGPGGSVTYSATLSVPNPVLWWPETPTLYSAVFSLKTADVVRDAERITFGIRDARFTADHGFFLNDKPLKIQGTCNHQDHAGVGAAVPDRLQAFRIGVLQQMGSNAVRTSHNMPTPELVAACDRMGMMMMCETRQMSSSPEGLAQLETMIKRYRNSPSIILWSIGNEEWHLQNDQAEQGAKIAATMVRRCHELDPTRVVSAAVNGDNSKGVSEALDIIGFNYNLKFPDDYHKQHPTKPVYGSETASTITQRGIYQTDRLRNTLGAYDYPENHTEWSELAEEWWTFYGTREWLAGGFAWTGFDYRGEPTPYGWPSINSNFGIVDMCGFPKDNFFYYKSWWTKQPVLHLFPHWNWEGREGDEIPVWVHSNLDEVELLLNGKSLGRQKVPRLGHVEWKVRYEPGTITAHGWKDGKLALTEERTTTGPAVALRLTAERTEIDADGEDLVVLTVSAVDSQGRAVPTADVLVDFKVTGEGALIGVGNGDPNCQESDKEPRRSLFSGLAQVIVQATKTAGTIEIVAEVNVRHVNIEPAKIAITTKQVPLRPAV